MDRGEKMNMRAKMRVTGVEKPEVVQGGLDPWERLRFTAVSKSEGYTEDGGDENNTYAKFTPTADLSMVINNPALLGKFRVNEEYYLDFTKAG